MNTDEQLLSVEAERCCVLLPARWRQFLRECEGRERSLTQYYFGTWEAKPREAEGYAEALCELLRDAVAVGAIELPAGYDTDDFTITLSHGGGGRGNLRNYLVTVTNRRTRRRETRKFLPPRSFGHTCQTLKRLSEPLTATLS